MTGGITQPIFHGGALFATRRGAIAAYDQAFAQYKQVLLQAFQNTADSLRAIETDARTFRAAKAAEKAAYRNFIITSQQYKDGGVAYINLLNAQQQYQQTRIASIQAQTQRYADTAALYQALGGGWWNRNQKQCPDNLNPVNASLTCP
jgi:outer membrane protein TolC